MNQDTAVTGFYAPVHRALIEPILLGGAPRAVAIVNGTLAAAIGLGLRLWIAGVVLWLCGHAAAVWAAKRDAAFVDVTRRHLRYPQNMVVKTRPTVTPPKIGPMMLITFEISRFGTGS